MQEQNIKEQYFVNESMKISDWEKDLKLDFIQLKFQHYKYLELLTFGIISSLKHYIVRCEGLFKEAELWKFCYSTLWKLLWL